MERSKEFKNVKYEKEGVSIDVRYDEKDHTIWLTQGEMCLLLNKDKTTISRHISTIKKNISVVASEATTEITSNDGKTYVTKIYPLDMIEAILKRSKSTSGYDFIKWANKLISNNMHTELSEISLDEDIKSKIYVIRGVQVMLDFELAEIYGYDTKRFNEQVKNNMEKFPTRYMFRISNEELESILRSKKSTSSWGGNRYLPYAFTEQGIYMLMTVLKGELATKQTIMLIDTFKAMKDYIIESNGSISNISLINDKFEKYDKRLTNVENQLIKVMDNFNNPKSFKHFVILKGERIETDIAYQNIYSLAKSSIIIVDDYIDIKTLLHLKVIKNNIDVTIITDNGSKIASNYINDFISDTNISLTFKRNNKTFHDRYIVIDYKSNNEIFFHSGPSSKDAGERIAGVNELGDGSRYYSDLDNILNKPNFIIK